MELREVEKYRPIPWGGVRLLAWVALAALVALGGAFFLGMIVPEASLSLEFWKGWMILFVIALTVLFRLGARRINDYWARNVRGYNVWFWRDEEQKIRVSFTFTRRGKKGDEDSNPLPCPVIKVPLGGWFNSSGGVYRHHFNEVGLAQGWKVRFPSDPWRDALSPHVTLIDAEGHSITLGIGIALDFCEYYFTGDRTTEWLLPVDVMLEEIKRLMTERDEARRQLKDAIAQIVGTIDHLDETKRFIKSRQAQEIRRGLVCELERLLPSDDPRRGKYGLATAVSCATGAGCCEATPAAPAQQG